MNIGQLDERVDIEQGVEAASSTGEITTTWSKLITVWSDVRLFSALEAWENDEHQAKVTHKFVIRYRDDVYTLAGYKMRVKYRGQYYNIDSIKELGRRTGLELRGFLYG